MFGFGIMTFDLRIKSLLSRCSPPVKSPLTQGYSAVPQRSAADKKKKSRGYMESFIHGHRHKLEELSTVEWLHSSHNLATKNATIYLHTYLHIFKMYISHVTTIMRLLLWHSLV